MPDRKGLQQTVMRRYVLFALALLLILGPGYFIFSLVEGAPAVGANPPANAHDAARTRIAVAKLKLVLDPDFGWNRLSISQGDMNSVLAVASRIFPFLRGRADVSSSDISVVLAAHVSNPLKDAWINVRLSVAPSKDQLRVRAVQIGKVEFSPSLFLEMLRFSIKAAMGEDLFGIALKSVEGIGVRGEVLSVGIDLSSAERNTLLAGSKRLFQKFAPANDVSIVRSYYRSLNEAAYQARLPTTGSFLPYLQFAFEMANERTGQESALPEIRSAILALAIYCGHWRVQYLVGEVITEDLARRPSKCDGVTLAGRKDLRRHFIISAALEAVGKNVSAFPIGEFKELLDSNPGGSGFSFEDLAADRTGIAFAARFLESAHVAEKREELVSKLTSEKAIMPDLDRLPEALSAADFEWEFATVESAEYMSVIRNIDQRIMTLPFFVD